MTCDYWLNTMYLFTLLFSYSKSADKNTWRIKKTSNGDEFNLSYINLWTFSKAGIVFYINNNVH